MHAEEYVAYAQTGDKLWGSVLEHLEKASVTLPPWWWYSAFFMPVRTLETEQRMKASYSVLETSYNNIVEAKAAMKLQRLAKRVSACDRRTAGAARQVNEALGRLVSTARRVLRKWGRTADSEYLEAAWARYQESRATARVATHLSRFYDLPAAMTNVSARVCV